MLSEEEKQLIPTINEPAVPIEHYLAVFRRYAGFLNSSFPRGLITFGYASGQFIYVVYTIVFWSASLLCGIEYATAYVGSFIALGVFIAYPGVKGQFDAFPNFIRSLFGEEVPARKPAEQTCSSTLWKWYNSFANNFSLSLNGWNLMEQLSLLWHGNAADKSFEVCWQRYWGDSLSYSWRLTGAVGMFLLQRGHVQYYYGSKEEKAKKPLFTFTGVALCYALGAYLMTAMPAIRFFMQQRDEDAPFSWDNSIDKSMVLHLLFGLVAMVPLRSSMYRNVYMDNHTSARKALGLDVVPDTLELEAGTIKDDVIREVSKTGSSWQRKLLLTFATLGVVSYQYYLLVLGMKAVFNDMIPVHIRDKAGFNIDGYIEAFIITDNVLAGLASWLRYMDKLVFNDK